MAEAAEGCKFRDCAHESEPGCGVNAALDSGELSDLRYANYLSLAAEAVAPKHPAKVENVDGTTLHNPAAYPAQNPASRLVGYAARCKIGPIKDFLIRSFIKAFKVDMSDYERQEPQEFENFNDFFTRSLKPGARPLPEDTQVLFSPVDGTISQIEKPWADA